MEATILKEKVLEIVKKQNEWRRKECINLIASESVLSPLAEKCFVSDFEGRYNEHSGKECHYQGTKYSYEIEEFCNEIFRKKFKTKFVDVRAISGGIANLIVYAAFCKPGDIIVSLGIQNGAHVSSSQYGLAGVRGLKSVEMFFDEKRMNIDVEKSVELIKKVKPKLVMLGASVILFPEPVNEIREMVNDVKIVYDASHVFGLIYNQEFQEPLKEGADLITSSTHKTFQGPQGGLIIGNNKLSEEDWGKVQTAIFPGILSNTHIHRFPALAITALEMNEFGKEYAKQVIKNAKTLARELYNFGFKVLCPELDFTESHQVIVNVKDFGGGKIVAEKLEKSNIICNKIALPSDSHHDATKNPSGIRLGVQELTRFGMKESEMKVVAEFFKKVLFENKNMKEEVKELKKEFQKVCYCFEA
ncbi:MAG: serine hydroxymethyltransferase [Candidatus Aenigmarchaeota archaeon]|nr:serine hydroxymethyltransferase [Candidatus Aenigmarchaeota archaeon]